MVRKPGVMVALTVVVVGCGGGEARRPARAANVEGRTTTTSAALTTSGSATASNATLALAATPPPPRPIETASAVMRVTTARCDREAACDHVGTGRSFGDRDECVNAVGHTVVGQLSADECPAGVDAERLSACLAEIDAKGCGDEADAGAMPSCARDTLCVPSQ